MPNDSYEHVKMLLNVKKNEKIVIECELRANVRFLAVMNASSRFWLLIQANDAYFLVTNSKRCTCVQALRERNVGPWTICDRSFSTQSVS